MGLFSVVASFGASAPRPAVRSGAAGTAEPTIVLSPFEVREDEDQGYLATTAQSGTRLRSELRDIAAPISVVTKDFMQDIGARNLEDLLTYTLSTEVGGVSGNFSESVSGALASGAEMNYDGAFQKLSVERGGHRVELKADGYEPLAFDVLITPGETVTYKGEMKRIQ